MPLAALQEPLKLLMMGHQRLRSQSLWPMTDERRWGLWPRTQRRGRRMPGAALRGPMKLIMTS